LHAPDGTPFNVTVDPSVVPYLALYPLPNAGINPGTFATPEISSLLGFSIFTRIFSHRALIMFSRKKDTLSATYIYDNGPETVPDNLGNTQTLLSAGHQVAGLTERHIFSSSLLNVVRIGYNRSTRLYSYPD